MVQSGSTIYWIVFAIVLVVIFFSALITALVARFKPCCITRTIEDPDEDDLINTSAQTEKHSVNTTTTTLNNEPIRSFSTFLPNRVAPSSAMNTKNLKSDLVIEEYSKTPITPRGSPVDMMPRSPIETVRTPTEFIRSPSISFRTNSVLPVKESKKTTRHFENVQEEEENSVVFVTKHNDNTFTINGNRGSLTQFSLNGGRTSVAPIFNNTVTPVPTTPSYVIPQMMQQQPQNSFIQLSPPSAISYYPTSQIAPTMNYPMYTYPMY